MNEQELMIFLQRILEYGTEGRSASELEQLKTILTEQKVSDNIMYMLGVAISSLPEAKEIAQKEIISPTTLMIAEQRADARYFRDLQMSPYRGCR